MGWRAQPHNQAQKCSLFNFHVGYESWHTRHRASLSIAVPVSINAEVALSLSLRSSCCILRLQQQSRGLDQTALLLETLHFREYVIKARHRRSRLLIGRRVASRLLPMLRRSGRRLGRF